MNAEKWQEDTTKGESPPPLISLWARAIENTEVAARLQPPESESHADQSSQPAPEEEPDSQETRASLLRAIESTELAARLQPPNLSPPPARAKSEPTLSSSPIASPPREGQPNRPLSDSPPQVAALSAVPQPGLPADHLQADHLPADRPHVLTPPPPTKPVATAAHLQQPEPQSLAGPRPQPAPDEEPDSREILNILLRAIENSQPAGDAQEAAPRIARPDLSLVSEPPKSNPTVSGSPMASPPLLVASPPLPVASPPMPMTSRPREGPRNRPFSTPPPQVATSSAVPQPWLLRDHPLVLTPTSQTKSAAAEKPLDNTPPRPSASVRGHFPGAAFIAKLQAELRWLAPKIAPSTRALLDGAEKRLSTWLRSCLALAPPHDPRRNQRLVKPPLVAYYWTGGTPTPQTVADISASGLYVATDDRWLLGTGISMALQRTDQERGTPGYWIAVNVMVIRQDDDGFGGMFIPSLPGLAGAAARGAGNGADKETLEHFVKQLAVSAQL